MGLLKVVALNSIPLHQNLECALSNLKRRFHIVLPGHSLKKFRPNLCLTVNDGSFHFYQTLFPLLVKYDLKVVLGISTAYILEEAALCPKERLAIPYALHMQEGVYDVKVPLCTWQELQEIVKSDHVEIAAYSHLHCNLTFSFVDLQREIVQPKQILEERLRRPITSFFYPFGRSSSHLHRYVRAHYPYGFGLGHGYHLSWKNDSRPLTRSILKN